MIVLYNILDILGTLMEMLVFYVAAGTFHLSSENKVRKYIPYIIWAISIYMLTWYTNVGEYKPLIGTLIMAVVMGIVFKTPLYKTAISCMLSMILIFLTESMGVILAYFLKIPTSIMVGDQMLVPWEMYLLIFACRAGGIFTIRCLFKDFLYEFTWKDCLMVLFNFVIIQIIWVLYNRNFFNGESDYFNLIIEFLCLLLSVGVLLPFFYLKNYYILREKVRRDEDAYKRLQEQYAYYRDKQKEEERVRSIYHDLKNHLLVLQGQIQNSDEIRTSLEVLQNEVSEYENYYRTGNEFLNIIIRDKARVAKEKQIDFSVFIHFEDGGFLQPLDISAIFGNALDNAIEASEKLPADKRMITVKASRVRDMLIATIENNTNLDSMPIQKTTKEDTFFHGMGLINIKNTAEKYDGLCSTSLNNGIFILKVMLPVPK